MFYERIKLDDGRWAISVSDIGYYNLKDTFECGQCFRHELIKENDGYIEYMTVVGDKIIKAAQTSPGKLLFFDMTDNEFSEIAIPYFSLETDYGKIRADIISRTDSDWLIRASDLAKGIAILKQDAWETLFSFIISQNNNIPRIRKIIKKICSEYGVNICVQNHVKRCPMSKTRAVPCDEICKSCGICYTFPSAKDVAKKPEKLLSSNPGFRYKYLCDAAKKVSTGEINLGMIAAARSYEHTMSCLTQIKGVGNKVASCVALFGFANLEAFPIDVWMKRAIDEYFNGDLDPATLGRYAGVAQQYIFHYIRNLSKN